MTVSDFKKVRPVGTVLIHVDRRPHEQT